MKNYPLWKIFLVFILVSLGVVFAIPSILYQEDTGNWYLDNRLNLGVDLQGGSYLLLEVQTDVLIDEEFENSSFFKKNNNLLIVFWLHDEQNINQHPIDKEILATFEYQLKDRDYEIIKKDWEHIRNRIRDCEAHNLRNRETVNLESCGGEGKADFYRDYSNSGENCHLPAKKKRFAYTKEFWNKIIDSAVN